MPTELDRMVEELRNAKIELDNFITEFNKAQEALSARLLEIFNGSAPRLSKYQENIDSINRAKLKEKFLTFYQLKVRYEADLSKGQHTLTMKELGLYAELAKQFPDYMLAMRDSDVLLVKKKCADEIVHINKCALTMINGVVMYKAIRTGIIAVLEEQMNLQGGEIKILESVLNFYAIFNYQSLAKLAPKLLLSKCLEAAKKMKESGVLGECSFVSIFKAKCMHTAYSYFLLKYVEVRAGELTIEKVKIYQYQNTDITKVQVIDTLKAMGQLLKDAMTNYVLARNLAAIEAKKTDASTIKEEINQEFVKLLVDSFGVDKDKMDRMRGFLVWGGNSELGKRQLETIKSDFCRIQHNGREGELQYVPTRSILYSEDEAGVTSWDMEEAENFNRGLLEAEMP